VVGGLYLISAIIAYHWDPPTTSSFFEGMIDNCDYNYSKLIRKIEPAQREWNKIEESVWTLSPLAIGLV
jgi:hypothetical protein